MQRLLELFGCKRKEKEESKEEIDQRLGTRARLNASYDMYPESKTRLQPKTTIEWPETRTEGDVTKAVLRDGRELEYPPTFTPETYSFVIPRTRPEVSVERAQVHASEDAPASQPSASRGSSLRLQTGWVEGIIGGVDKWIRPRYNSEPPGEPDAQMSDLRAGFSAADIYPQRKRKRWAVFTDKVTPNDAVRLNEVMNKRTRKE